MNPVLPIIILVAAIAAIAFALYKAGFSVEKLKVKLGIVEVEAGRDRPTTDKEPTRLAGPDIRQQATEGGTIEKSGITAPADTPAKIDQQAKGEKSKIDDSPIELT